MWCGQFDLQWTIPVTGRAKHHLVAGLAVCEVFLGRFPFSAELWWWRWGRLAEILFLIITTGPQRLHSEGQQLPKPFLEILKNIWHSTPFLSVESLFFSVSWWTFVSLAEVNLITQLVKNPLQCKRSLFSPWDKTIPWRRDRLPTPIFLDFPCWSAGRESACNAGDVTLIPGLGRSLE